ncbi:branched-chain amino acid ABC transporter permease [soil metagenome]
MKRANVIQDLLNAAVLGSIYLLAALGMSLTWGTIGILNFAHGAVFMFSAFSAYLLSTVVTLPAFAYVIVAALVGAALSVLIYVFAFAPIHRRAADHRTAEVQILIGGIGVAAIPVAIAQYVTKSGSFGFTAASENVVLEFAGIHITTVGLTILVLAIAISTATAVWLKKSRVGLALRAVGVDPETARLMGINESRLALGTMAASGLFAGLAGAMLSLHLVAINPNTGDGFLIKAFAVIVLGGVGSVAGVVVGSFALAFVETFVILAGAGSWADGVAFALIFIVLLFRPQGIFGRKEVKRT